MYVPIGGDMSIRDKSIIGIFDLDNTSISKHTRKFLKQSQEEGQVVTVTDELPKSFILTAEYGMSKVYLTQFHSKSLCHRVNSE